MTHSTSVTNPPVLTERSRFYSGGLELKLNMQDPPKCPDDIPVLLSNSEHMCWRLSQLMKSKDEDISLEPSLSDLDKNEKPVIVFESNTWHSPRPIDHRPVRRTSDDTQSFKLKFSKIKRWFFQSFHRLRPNKHLTNGNELGNGQKKISSKLRFGRFRRTLLGCNLKTES